MVWRDFYFVTGSTDDSKRVLVESILRIAYAIPKKDSTFFLD